jgi:hypothetical protein
MTFILARALRVVILRGSTESWFFVFEKIYDKNEPLPCGSFIRFMQFVGIDG